MVDLVQTPPRAPSAPPDRPRRSRAPVIALLVLIVGALVAIGVLISVVDDGPSNTGPLSTGTSTPTATSATTLDPQATVKAAILDAYRQSTDAFVAVASDPNGKPTDPRLEEHKVGNALLASQMTIDRLRKAGHVFRGTIEVHPVVIELTADTAVVQDCGLDRVGVFSAATGEVVTPVDNPPTPSLARATYKLINGVWMQNGFKDLKQQCAPPAS